MRIRKPLFALGVFFFGSGIMFVSNGMPFLGEIRWESDNFTYAIPIWVFPALISFLLAGILLALSLAE
jgi:hypothetical protein